MTTNPKKDYLVSLSRIVHAMIKKGHFQEACLFGRFIQNNDKVAIRILNKRFNRIFNEQDIKEMANVVFDITNKYTPEYMRGSDDSEADFITDTMSNIIPFHKRSGN